MIDALLKEIELTKGKKEHKINTIDFGGGTPSLLSLGELQTIMDKITQDFEILGEAEITLEANPDDISETTLESWQNAGVNRLSVGIQSFRQEDLHWMNRVHDVKQSHRCIELIKTTGLSNFSIDLIFGIPGQSDADWERNVRNALDYGVPHLSCYALTVEPKTALQKLIATKKLADVNGEQQARQYLLLMRWMEQAGYEHYEISNFALPARRSRHNSSYWQRKPYFGLGPSAHSFHQNTRSWNVSSNAAYIQSLKMNIIPSENEILTPVQQLNEYIMTSLRTMEGMDLRKVEREYGTTISQKLKNACNKYQNSGEMQLYGEILRLSQKGKLFADGIAASLFFENIQ